MSEILLSMAVFALLLVTAVSVLHWALQASRAQQAKTTCAWLAQGQMEQLEETAEPKAGKGRFAPPHQDYHWESQVSSLSPEPFLDLNIHVSGPGGASYWLQSRRRAQRRALLFRSTHNMLLRANEEEETPAAVFSEPIPSSFSLSPDGQTLAYAQTVEGRPQIFTRRLDGSEPGRLLFVHPGGAGEPAYSPDGRELAFTAQENGVSQLFCWNFAQRRFRNLSRSSHQDGSPCWLPDGRGLIVCRDTSSIVLLSQGSERVLVDSPEGWNAVPNVSPDGKTLVFMSTRDGNPEIYRLDLSSRKLRRLTNNPGYDSEPRFSRDGKRIAFTSRDEAGQSHLYSMNPDGSNVTPIAPDVRGEGAQWVSY